jgi:uncharacterized protein (DUF305 family)
MVLGAVMVAAAVGRAQEGASTAPVPQGVVAQARRDSAQHPYTAADVAFMQGMIEHHAQAIAMSKWAPGQGASPSVETLAARIINAQRDEIALMSQWLRDRQLSVPVPDTLGVKPMVMGAGHEMAMMPGMLTPDQMAELHAAHGEAFDRLFLQDMIQHHQGAVTMVRQLFDTYGAAEDPRVFKLASDANVDQTTEIARMRRMLLVTTLGVSPGGDPQ